MSILWVLAGSFILLEALERTLRAYFFSQLSHLDGKRAAFEELRSLIQEKSRIAIAMAPDGGLQLGLIRARVLDDLYLEISELKESR